MTHAELRAAGYDLDPTAYGLLQRFADLLLAENRRLNLTAIRDAPSVWRTHICDSLALLPLLREIGAQTLLDLGTGGGLPGVPLACVAPDLHVTLLDATAKKLAAVERIVAALGLTNVTFACGRAETLAHDPRYREQFDALTARAVADLPVLLEYAAGFVRVGGVCLFPKTAAALETELPAAASAAEKCGLEWTGRREYVLPGEPTARTVAIYRKLRALPANLPRAAGRPKKRPL